MVRVVSSVVSSFVIVFWFQCDAKVVCSDQQNTEAVECGNHREEWPACAAVHLRMGNVSRERREPSKDPQLTFATFLKQRTQWPSLKWCLNVVFKHHTSFPKANPSSRHIVTNCVLSLFSQMHTNWPLLITFFFVLLFLGPTRNQELRGKH